MNTQRTLTAISSTVKKQWFVLSAFAVMVLLAIALMTGGMLFTKQVYVTDEGVTKTFLTSKDDINEILSENGYDIKIDDEIKFSGFENNEGTVEITRAFDVALTADGKVSNIAVTGGTVGDALKKAGVLVNENDILIPSADTLVSENTAITLQRVTFDTAITENAVPFDTVQVNSAAVKKGTTTVTTAGVNGIETVETKNMYVDGVLKSSEIISQQITKEPVDQVVTVGTKSSNTISQLTPPSSLVLDKNGVPVNYTKVLTGKSAAYSAKPTAKTASGRTVKVGYVAVNPKIIPYGTKLYIMSTDGKHVYGYAIAADTGAALMDGRILVDLFVDSYQSACNWGVHQVNIYVLP